MKIGIIYGKNFHYDGVRPADGDLLRLTKEAEWIDADGGREDDRTWDYDCLVLLHGAYFPKAAWPQIMAHLRRGGGLVHVGAGVPFSIPVRPEGTELVAERKQSAYHAQLGIPGATDIGKEERRFSRLEVNEDLPWLREFAGCFSLQDTIGLMPQFTDRNDIPGESGSSGPMNGAIQPLIRVLSEAGRPVAAPAVVIDQWKGGFAGGRWIFLNVKPDETFWKNGGAELIAAMAAKAARKSREIRIRPGYASYYAGEQPSVILSAETFGADAAVDVKLTVRKDGQPVHEQRIELALQSCEPLYRSIPLPLQVSEGLYDITAEVRDESGGHEATLRSGFWGYDRELLRNAPEVTCGRDYFRIDGKTAPIVGMTYMASDVHRKYGWLPNPSVWDRDIAEMKRAGINMLRTGIWTGHRHFMFVDGVASEEMLRAIDAFFLTCAKHAMPVTFTFFTFVPEMWEGVNPYLDPRSVAAQKRFIASIASRHAESRHVNWDLINEPSICNPNKLWKAAPNRDAFELAAWRNWLRERHGDIAVLQERWNVTPERLPSFDACDLPEDQDFITEPDYPEPFSGLKAHDYYLFSQDVFNGWCAAMTKTIRAAGAKQPVTAGQDESLNIKKPSPLFYQESVDYTSNHTWWQMDDLYWNGVFSKSPDKLNLIQETGLMYVQNADGSARRTEAELHRLLERKYALAYAAANAGAIQWLWNVNLYMTSLNEVNIGAVRGDGTQKAEADVSYDFGEFFRAVGEYFEDRAEPEVAVVYPYANDFSARPQAVQATRTLTRVLGYGLNIPFQVYGEYHLERLHGKKLIIVPSPGTMTEALWRKLLDEARLGATVLVTGSISRDEYFIFRRTRMADLGLGAGRLVQVQREEWLYDAEDGTRLPVVYGHKSIAWTDKELPERAARAQDYVVSLGKGKVIWCPLPLEMNLEQEVISRLYRKALALAGVRPPFEWKEGDSPGVLGQVLPFRDGKLYVFVSESGEDAACEIRDPDSGAAYRFTVPAARSVLFFTGSDGSVVRSYQNRSIERIG